MIETKVAKRYAKSLIDLANEKNVLEAVNNDMKMFTSVSSQNRDLELLLSNPIVNGDKKFKVFQQIFGQRFNSLTMTFLDIVIKKGREKYLVQIAKNFTEQYKIMKKIITAEVISAIGLDDNLRKKIYDMIRKDSNSEVELVEKVDKKLIGGFVLRIGDSQYDASISSEIRKLAQAFSDNTYIKRN
jgi:F-type H+-transporting ATPase subunit delta